MLLFIQDLIGFLRRTVRCLSIIVLVAAAVIVAAWFGARAEIVVWLIQRGLHETPFPDTRYSVAEVLTDRTVLTDVTIDGLARIDRVVLTYSFRQLLDGRVEAVRLTGTTLKLNLDENNILTGKTAEVLAWVEGDGSGDQVSPFAHLVAEAIEVRIVHPEGEASIAFDGALQAGPGSLSGAGSWTLRSGIANGDGTISYVVDPLTGAQTLVVTPRQINVAHEGIGLSGITGALQVTLASPHEPIAWSADLRATEGEIDGYPTGPLALQGTWDGHSAFGDLMIGHETSALSATLSFVSGPVDEHIRIASTGFLAIREPLALPILEDITFGGPAQMTFSLEGQAPGSGPLSPGAVDVAGSARIVTGPLAVRETLAIAASELALEAALSVGVLDIVASEGGHLHELVVHTPAEDDGVSAAFDRTFDVTVPPGGVVVRLPVARDETALTGSLTAAITSGETFEGQVFVRGDAGFDVSGIFDTFSLSTFEFAASGDIIPDAVDGIIRLSGQLSGTPAIFDGAVNLQARLDTAATADVEARGVVLDMPLRIEHVDGATQAAVDPVALFRADSLEATGITATGLLAELPLNLELIDKRFHVRLTDTAWLDLESAEHPRFRSWDATSIKLEPESLPLLVLERFNRDWSWDVRLLIGPTGAHVDLFDEGNTLATLRGTLPNMGIRFGSLGSYHFQGTIETDGGDLAVLGPDVRLGDIRILATYNNGLSDWPQINADIRQVEDILEPARFSPMVADFSVSPVWPLGDDMRFNGNLHMDGRRYLANMEASYEPETERLRALVRVPAIRFEDGSQPQDVSPLYGTLLTDATGAIELYGEIVAERGVTSSNLTLSFLEVSGRNGDIAIEGLDGSVTFTNVAPLSTPPQQTLSARRIDAGVPLTDLAVTLSLPGDDSLLLQFASAELAGGHVVVNPSILRFMPDGNEVMLNIRGIDLGTLLENVDIPGLSIDARLTGSIPVVISDDDVVIKGGRLDADSPGTLHYTPGDGDMPFALDDENMALVLGAFENFQFTALGVDINREAGGETELGLHIAGANPDLYDGYPIELNVNLTGDLDRIVRDSLAGWRISEEIRERLSGF
ncbi:MAG: YdbH domain-containing protein [Rhodospirillales bacterium]|nr:YdbH domain-containing protein [Rhodospirillales bacterium]